MCETLLLNFVLVLQASRI